ncbi:MAG: hypothetical protein MUF51_11715, partial [Vicinamibacteria bacterium]|nr:hypothetical protein [Vicinamibacteria bacterium]
MSRRSWPCGRASVTTSAHAASGAGQRFPSTVESAITLPGVGLYTASAVLSIAFGRPLPVVDGNVRRVLARLLALKGRRWRKDGPYYNVADELLDRREPGDWNQALMELGATLCRPRRPLCPLCPWSAICSAHAQGNAEDYPEKKSRRTTIAVSILAVVIERDGRTLLARQDADAPLKGLWAVPHTPLDSERAPDIAEIEKIYGLKLKAGPGVGSVTHAITHRRITVAIMRADW